jgi:hypothetical protein
MTVNWRSGLAEQARTESIMFLSDINSQAFLSCADQAWRIANQLAVTDRAAYRETVADATM